MNLSIIIPTFNRFDALQNAIQSVLSQIDQNSEIIVINDGSTDEKYYTKKNKNTQIRQINLKVNQKIKNGFSSDAIRNIGALEAKGKYIGFLDDDDIWLPGKIETQIDILEKSNNKISCTDGYFGLGFYEKKKKYNLYNQKHFYKQISEKYKKTKFNENKMFKKFEFPSTFNYEFIDIHNCIVTSSVLVESKLFKEVGMFDSTLINGIGDYDCWKKILRKSDCEYIKDPLFYYDGLHAGLQHYK
jgi:glycosyltransferase involved in cell wall biosynthesis